MSYTFYDISKKQDSVLDLKNCTIKGNSTAYVVKDGNITKYSIVNGQIDNNTAENVEKIELTNYQLTLFNALRWNDGNSKVFDNKDLKNVSPDSLRKQINNIYKENNIYNVVAANINKNSAELSITDSSKTEKRIAVEFEEEPGFFKKIWNGICRIFKSIGKLFSSESENKPEKTETKQEAKPIENSRIEIKPATVMTIGENDEHDPIKLSNDLGISYSRLKMVNKTLDLTQPLTNGTVLNIPEIKVVKPNSVTNIAETAEAAGVSKEYVQDILFKIEGKNGIAAKVPYDDEKEYINDNGYPVQIKGREKNKNGTLTIGYGHTGRVFGQIMTRNNRNNIKITDNQAFELLAADIISAKSDAEEYYGESFTNAPQSIQDAIVDIVFNKGLEKGLGLEKFQDCKEQTLTPQIKQCLENKDYAGCISKLIYETGLKGLHKRNYYRLISAMRDLSSEEQSKALKDIEPYYNKVCSLYKKNLSESNYIKQAWRNAQNGIFENFMN